MPMDLKDYLSLSKRGKEKLVYDGYSLILKRFTKEKNFGGAADAVAMEVYIRQVIICYSSRRIITMEEMMIKTNNQ